MLSPTILKHGAALCQALKRAPFCRKCKGSKPSPRQHCLSPAAGRRTRACPQVALSQCPQACLTRPGTKGNDIAGLRFLALSFHSAYRSPVVWREQVSALPSHHHHGHKQRRGQRGLRAMAMCRHDSSSHFLLFILSSSPICLFSLLSVSLLCTICTRVSLSSLQSVWVFFNL